MTDYREPLLKPIRCRIEQGTVQWKDGRVKAERISCYQEGQIVGFIVRRIRAGRTETNDVIDAIAETFLTDGLDDE